ncbi:MAG: DUF1573 domain-containing protein [Prevotella sp.]|nr:DUF1573 domain-containing protein [Prevotella sp.]
MLFADTLVVIGLASASLGTIHEADGVVERTFWLRNDGTAAVTLRQGYTSCGCTTIQFAKDAEVQPGDSTAVVLRFNPQGKGGEFEEVGTVVYGDRRKRATVSMVGTCVTSEETLLRQFPIRVDDRLRLSANRLDLGRMHVGETKERGVVVLHCDEDNRQERIPISFTVGNDMPKGLQHIDYPVKTKVGDETVTLSITIDVFIY